MSPGRTPEEVRAFGEAIGAPGYGGGMGQGRDWMSHKAVSTVRAEVQLGESRPVEGREGHVRETNTFYANRFSRRQFERQLADVAESLGVEYSAEVKAGLLLCDIVVTAEGEQEAVERFMKYAIGLSAASDGDSGATGP